VTASDLRYWGSGRVGDGNGPSLIDQTSLIVHLHCISVNTSAKGAGVISPSRAHKRDHQRQPRVARKEKGEGEASVHAITRITRSRSLAPAGGLHLLSHRRPGGGGDGGGSGGSGRTHVQSRSPRRGCKQSARGKYITSHRCSRDVIGTLQSPQ